MKATLWGTRGSLASPGPDTIRYGGNTSCVSVIGSEGTLLVLDSGTGIRLLGHSLPVDLRQVHILLSHLHMDHVQGLPFFEPLRQPGIEVHIWGPASNPVDLEERLIRYLSPPLFPIRVRDLLSKPVFHALGHSTFEINELRVATQMVIHPNPTIGYRIQDARSSLAYLPDHEPALGAIHFPYDPEWTSGYNLAHEVDLLIHDAQYTTQEYDERVGYGHSSVFDALRFAHLADVKQLAPFHHDPGHSDDLLDQVIGQAISDLQPSFQVTPGREGSTFYLD